MPQCLVNVVLHPSARVFGRLLPLVRLRIPRGRQFDCGLVGHCLIALEVEGENNRYRFSGDGRKIDQQVLLRPGFFRGKVNSHLLADSFTAESKS
jgi:hypothetical protein